MKLTVLFLATSITLFAFSTAYSSTPSKSTSLQDTIFKKNGEVYFAKILKINQDSIFYQLYGSNKTLFFLASEVISISYNDGKIVFFSKPDNQYYPSSSNPPIAVKTNAQEMYYRGLTDAKIYFRNKGYFWMGTPLILANFFGLIIAGIISLVPPSKHNLMAHDKRITGNFSIINGDINEIRQLFADPNYVSGYQRGAWGKKAGSIWLGFLAGFVVVIILYAILFYLFIAALI